MGSSWSEGEIDLTTEDAFESLVRQRLRAQHGVLDRAPAGFVVGARRIDLALSTSPPGICTMCTTHGTDGMLSGRSQFCVTAF